MKRFTYILTTTLLCLLSACSGKSDKSRTLMVSIPPQKFVLEQIAGDKWTVECMLEKATSAESYDPEMSQMVKLERCRAYFLIGNLGFETKVAQRLMGDTAQVLIDSAKGIATIAGHSHHGEAEIDPHVWMSVANMRFIARNMASALKSIDPTNKDFYASNLKRLDSQLAALDGKVRESVGNNGGTFVVWHPSLTYFARDYGLTQISMEYEGKEAPMSYIASKIDEARQHNASVFFIQEGADERQAATVSDRMGIKQVSINPLSYDWANEMEKIANAIKSE